MVASYLGLLPIKKIKSAVLSLCLFLTSTFYLVLPLTASSDPEILKMVFVPASEKGDVSDYESLIKIISKRAKVQIEPIKVVDYNAAVEAMRAN